MTGPTSRAETLLRPECIRRFPDFDDEKTREETAEAAIGAAEAVPGAASTAKGSRTRVLRNCTRTRPNVKS